MRLDYAPIDQPVRAADIMKITLPRQIEITHTASVRLERFKIEKRCGIAPIINAYACETDATIE